MKVKVYRATLKDQNVSSMFYMVDAPNKRIAKWCGANLYNNEHMSFLSAKDMKVERYRYKELHYED